MPGNWGRTNGPSRIDELPVEMAAFDGLPAELRELLRYLPISVSAVSVSRNLRVGDPAALVRIVRYQVGRALR